MEDMTGNNEELIKLRKEVEKNIIFKRDQVRILSTNLNDVHGNYKTGP